MLHQVLIFAFDAQQRVVLVRKDGMLDGVGGEVVHPESSIAAACREFREETGVDLEPERMKLFAMLRHVIKGWTVECFRVLGAVDGVVASEEIVVTELVAVAPDVIPNLRWLVPLAWLNDSFVTATYMGGD
jgi:8-oxo-dGTP pyrophosphatase MutT (NUDIX family)